MRGRRAHRDETGRDAGVDERTDVVRVEDVQLPRTDEPADLVQSEGIDRHAHDGQADVAAAVQDQAVLGRQVDVPRHLPGAVQADEVRREPVAIQALQQADDDLLQTADVEVVHHESYVDPAAHSVFQAGVMLPQLSTGCARGRRLNSVVVR
jgi:hypothetical protein